MEITNNAIEHSGAKKIHVQAQKSIGKIRITIQDDGIGIFKKIKDSLGLQNEKQALTTTNPNSKQWSSCALCSRKVLLLPPAHRQEGF